MKAKQKRGKEKNADKESDSVASYVSTEEVRGVCAIFCIAIAGFLILAQLGGGGAIGGALYEWLSWLLGIGYLLLPLSLVLLAILIFRSFERNFGWVQFVAMTVFLLAGLGLINLAFAGQGGILGISISDFIIAGVDTTATVIFLIAFIIASSRPVSSIGSAAPSRMRSRRISRTYPLPDLRMSLRRLMCLRVNPPKNRSKRNRTRLRSFSVAATPRPKGSPSSRRPGAPTFPRRCPSSRATRANRRSAM